MKWLFVIAALCLLTVAPREAAAQNNYAAIAFNKETGGSGRSYNYPSRARAEERALEECGRGCFVVAWIRNQCLALAVGRGNGYGYSMSVGARRAAEGALFECRKRTDNCRLNSETCS
jgi:hypothetical protein